MNMLQVHRIQVQCQDSEDAIEGVDFEPLVSSVEVLSKADRDYQQLILQKQKSAAEWDMRDSKMLMLR